MLKVKCRNDRSKFKYFLLAAAAVVFFVGLDSAHAMGKKPQVFEITLKVDFGPAGKPGFEDKKFQVEKGTTPKEAVSQVYPVLSGKSCCSLREVLGIDGVSIDPMKNRWWVCELNGSRKFSPHQKKLQPGDRVEWKYIQNVQ